MTLLKTDPEQLSAILLSDIDGVIADWYKGYNRYLSKYLGVESTGEMPTVFNMTDVYPDLEKPWDFINEYQTSDDYLNMEIFSDVRYTLETLKENNVEVQFITSCGIDKQTVEMRKEWLQYHLSGLYTDVHFLNLGEDKTRILSQFQQYTNYAPVIFIDDQAKMLPAAKELGFHPVLKNMEYNQDENSFERIYTYGELVDIITLETLIHKTCKKHSIEY